MQDSIPAAFQVVSDTIVTLDALRNSQEFYNSAFERIQSSYAFFLTLCGIFFAIINIIIGTITIKASRENKKLENADKELKEKFETKEKELIALLGHKQKELETLYQNKETESMKECKSVKEDVMYLKKQFDFLSGLITNLTNKDFK